MITEWMNQTGLVIGLFACIGLLIERKSLYMVAEGTVKAVLGYMIMSYGAQLATDKLTNFTMMLSSRFNVKGIVPNSELAAGVTQWLFDGQFIWIMSIGMALHLVIARFTTMKFIFLTGHHVLFMSALLSAVLAGSTIPVWLQYVIGGSMLGLSMTWFPYLCQPYMNRIFDNQRVALGSFGGVGYVIAGAVGKRFGSKQPDKHREGTDLSALPLFTDPPTTITLFMLILFISVTFATGETWFLDYTGQNAVVYTLIQTFQFAAGMYILITGVRMLLSVFISAFNGIANRIVPDAIPALDSPIVFAYAPVAVVIGFMGSLLGGFLAFGIMLVLDTSIIIPAIVSHFISGGTAGVIAYAVGGVRGAIIGSIAHGLSISFLSLFVMPIMNYIGYTNTTFSESDLNAVGIILYQVLKYLNLIG